jgi:uncharacterized surface protein with fasciclin (FAS1) repeats
MKKSILKYFKAFTLVGVMASFIALSSCGEDDGGGTTAPTLTVYGTLSAQTNLGKLKGEFDAYADIVATLDDADADLTVFAPSDAAMTTLLTTLGLTDFSTVSAGIAKSVLNYHISTAGSKTTGELTVGSTVMTAQGEVITIDAGTKLKTGATALSTIVSSIEATNGIIHIVDVVIIPPTIGAQIVATLGTVAQPLLLGSNFTILAQGMAKADAGKTDPATTIVGLLVGGANLTVFAPTNATFAAGQITVDSYDAATWNAIIRNHIVVAQGGDGTETIGSDDMTTGASFTTVLQGTLFFVQGDPVNGVGVFIDSNGDFNAGPPPTGLNAEVALIDAAVSGNGRIHVIAGVLSPPSPQ